VLVVAVGVVLVDATFLDDLEIHGAARGLEQVL
jgi:hypothetical protein